MSKDKKPTQEFYELFQFIYDYLNSNLFENELPNCMIVITRKGKTFGYFQPERWINNEKIKTDEIAINPMYFDKYPLIEILQTMAHEMCLLWQHHFGKPSKRTYHNKEWANKMVEIGLMPSNTGKVGGKMVGQQMMEYPIVKGQFVKTANKLISQRKFKNLWFDREIKKKTLESIQNSIEDGERVRYEDQETHEVVDRIQNELYDSLNLDDTLLEIRTLDNEDLNLVETKSGKRTKYHCKNCDVNLWGKKDLIVICGTCDTEFQMITVEN